MKTSIVVCALLFGLLFLVPLRAAELPGATVPEGLGVNIHFTDPRPGEMDMLADAGFRWVRMDFAWSAMEREKGVYNFAAWDRLMAALDAKKIRALFILDYSNVLYDGGVAPSTDEGRAAFARWAAAAVRHFRNRGILWEMYNEPNLDGFWKPKADVNLYVKLALAVGKAIREAEPNEIQIGPATSGVDFNFLEACFKAGLLEYWSAVSVHPYRRLGPETATPDYARLRKLIDQYAPKGKQIPILSGEWGYSAAWEKFDETRQGKMLPRQWLANMLNNVPLSIWYDWHDDGDNLKEFEHHFGTVRFPYRAAQSPVYEPKPAYLAAKTLTATLAGYRFQRRVPTVGPDDYVLEFAKSNEMRWAAWTASAESHPVTVPLPAGKYAVVGHAGQAMPSITADAKGLSLTLTDAPVYLWAKSE